MNKFIVFFFTGFLAYHYNPNQDLDLYRYYEYARSLDYEVSILRFIEITYVINFDFIYFCTFLVFGKLGIAKEFATALFVGLFYSQTLLLLELVEKKLFIVVNRSSANLIKIFTLCSVTPILILSISRNLAAIAILIVGVNYFLKNKKICYAFFVVSIFTHVVMIVYIPVLIVFYSLKSIRINNRNHRNTLLIFSTIFGFASKMWIDEVLMRVQQIKFFDSFSRYSIYVEKSDVDMGSIFDVLVFYDILPIFVFTAIILTGLLSIKRYCNIIWVAYYYYIVLVISIGYSSMLTQRAVMLLLPLQGIVSLFAFSQLRRSAQFIMMYKLMLVFNIVVVILNMYSYRVYLFG